MARVSHRLTVVLPVYNEGGGIEAVVQELQRIVLDRMADARLIVVDDASSDDSLMTLRRCAAADARIRVETSTRNAGHGSSVLRALELADGDWLFQLDSDGQFDVSDFWKLWERCSDADLIVGWRQDRKDPRHRLLLAWTVRYTARALGAHGVMDANSPFRLIRGELWDDVAPFVRAAPIAPSITTTVAAAARGWRLLEVPVEHHQRTQGHSSLGPRRLALLSSHGLIQLLRLRAQLAQAARKRRRRQ